MSYFFDFILVGGVVISLFLFFYGISLYSSIKKKLMICSPKIYENFFVGGIFGSSIDRQRSFNKFIFAEDYSSIDDLGLKELLGRYAFVGRVYRVVFSVTILVFFAAASGFLG